MLKVIDINTQAVLGTITTTRSMTIDEACDLLGIKVMRTQEDYEAGNGYDYYDLDVVC